MHGIPSMNTLNTHVYKYWWACMHVLEYVGMWGYAEMKSDHNNGSFVLSKIAQMP